jgi:RibD C-terminal domain
LNTKPKYLASTTLTEPRWANTTVLSGDVAAAIGELKAKPGGELQAHGSGALIRWLLDNDLVDEINLLIVPVVLGQGTRLFPDAGPDIALDLVDSRADTKGVTIVYRPKGARGIQRHRRPRRRMTPAAASGDVPERWRIRAPSLSRVGLLVFGFWETKAIAPEFALPAKNLVVDAVRRGRGRRAD